MSFKIIEEISNGQVDEKDLDANSIEIEYKNLTNTLSRYENQGFKVIPAFTFLVTATFAVGSKYDLHILYILIPFVGLATIQMLIAVNYAYRVRQNYLKILESSSRKNDGPNLCFYSEVQDSYLNYSNVGSTFLPLFGFVGMGVFVILILSGYSTYLGYHFLSKEGYRAWSFIFIGLVVGLGFYCGFSFRWSLNKLRNL